MFIRLAIVLTLIGEIPVHAALKAKDPCSDESLARPAVGDIMGVKRTMTGLAPIIKLADGGTTSNGNGSGIACFASADDRDRALTELENEGSVSGQTISQVKTFELTDIPDLKAHLPEKCVRLPIVNRHSKSEWGFEPDACFESDPRLYSLLGQGEDNPKKRILEQAMLILHEALYLVGSELGHGNSVGSRLLAAKLLTPDFYADLKKMNPDAPFNPFLDDALSLSQFNLYPFVLDDKKSGQMISPGSMESRRRSYSNLSKIVYQAAAQELLPFLKKLLRENSSSIHRSRVS
jgi:hypothetical protein